MIAKAIIDFTRFKSAFSKRQNLMSQFEHSRTNKKKASPSLESQEALIRLLSKIVPQIIRNTLRPA